MGDQALLVATLDVFLATHYGCVSARLTGAGRFLASLTTMAVSTFEQTSLIVVIVALRSVHPSFITIIVAAANLPWS